MPEISGNSNLELMQLHRNLYNEIVNLPYTHNLVNEKDKEDSLKQLVEKGDGAFFLKAFTFEENHHKIGNLAVIKDKQVKLYTLLISKSENGFRVKDNESVDLGPYKDGKTMLQQLELHKLINLSKGLKNEKTIENPKPPLTPQPNKDSRKSFR